MTVRSAVSWRPFVPVLIIAAASSVAGCGDDGGASPAALDAAVDSGVTDAFVTASTSADAGFMPDAAIDDASAVADARADAAVPEPDAATYPSPDTGQVPVFDAGAVDAGYAPQVDASPIDADAATRSSDSGSTDSGQLDASSACFENTPNEYRSDTFDPCGEVLGAGCVTDAGASTAVLDACNSALFFKSKAVFEAALACFEEQTDGCAVDAKAQFDTCLVAASTDACPLQEAGCDTFESACGELTAAECNALLAPMSADWVASLSDEQTGLLCFERIGTGCGDVFLNCIVGAL